MSNLNRQSIARPMRNWRRALAGSALLLFAHLVLILLTYRDRRLLAVSSNVLLALESLAPAVVWLMVTRSLAPGEPRTRSGRLLLLALFAEAISQVIWTGYRSLGGGVPSLSPADLFNVLFYWAFAASVLVHPAMGEHAYVRAKRVLELLSVFLGSGLLFGVISVATAPSGPSLAPQALRPLAALYPASAAAMFAALVFVLQSQIPGDSRTAFKLLWFGAAARLVTDALFSLLSVRGAYVDGGFMDLGYTLASLSFALAGVWFLNFGRKFDPAAGSAPISAPFVRGSRIVSQLGLVLTFGLLVWAHFHAEALNFLVVALAAGLVVALLMAREFVALKELVGLYAAQRRLTDVLRAGHDELEARVFERTAALELANAALAGEAEQLRLARADLQASLVEKEALLQEVHHRVKNNLQVVSSLLALQARTTKGAGAVEALLTSQSRLRAMGLIHQKLYDSGDLARVHFDSYLRGLMGQLLGIYGVAPDKVQMSVLVTAGPLNLNVAVPCGLIVNELVSNALKHAFPGDRQGTVAVSLTPLDDHCLQLRVADDGIGLPPGMEVGRSKSLGLNLIGTLVRQLNGQITVDRTGGTAFLITFDLLTTQ